MKTLRELYGNILVDGGIFSFMNNMPWDDYITGEELDLLFFSDYGDKTGAPIFNYVMENDVLTNIGKQKISQLLEKKYKYNWTRLFNLLSLDYKPLDNFLMETTGTISDSGSNTETIENSGTDTTTINSTVNSTDNNTITYDVTDTVNSTNTEKSTQVDSKTFSSTKDTSKYGFDSSSPSPSDKVISEDEESTNNTVDSTNSNDGTNKLTGTEENESSINNTQNSTNEFTRNTKIDTTKNLDNTKTHNITRSGRTGNMSNQSLINEEIKLWEGWNFFKDIFIDVAQTISLSIYKIEL